ncbi:hypothetical protein [Tolypothrix sp. NIES-4075]|uniref:hypothetical protein n=1 Tax=Tolypothrix sp. NIES-4075 TaxID=2005459 RepID=UPI00117CD0B6|nr:hypothetical protein [Tolypothrix sp. NIES-4075]
MNIRKDAKFIKYFPDIKYLYDELPRRTQYITMPPYTTASELIVANCILTESKASESEKSPLSTARR